MEIKALLFGEAKEIITFKKRKWKVINRSKVVDKEDRTKIIDYFIVALSGRQALSYLESNMAESYHIDNWKTCHTKFWNTWRKRGHDLLHKKEN